MEYREILHLFQRPSEPICIPKGEGKVGFAIPPSYLPDEYKTLAVTILDRVGESVSTTVPIKEIEIPNLSAALMLSRRETFSMFVPKHRKAASYLMTLFMGMKSYDELLSLAVFCRDRVNTEMFIYALSLVVLHRKDTKNLPVPQLMEIFPEKFLDSATFGRVIEEVNVVPSGSRRPIVIPLNYTATDHDPEHRVAYWREDFGLNLHHYHWHLVYPPEGPEEVMNKDRRGEIFYYMHHQMLARFNCERLSNKLPRVKKLNEFRDPINEAYFPKLDSSVASRTWPGRPPMAFLSDVNRPMDGIKVDISDMLRERDRILEAIHTKSVKLPDGTTMALTEETGIDVLGELIDASSLSINSAYYGNFHTNGHILLGHCHDPDHRYLESFGVMGDPATAARDPVFYRWHTHVNEILLTYKNSLNAYTVQQLNFPGITITECRINTPGTQPNNLMTHWAQDDFELGNGLDFAPHGRITIRATHLNHTAFTYNIKVKNTHNQPKRGTVRIFMAPTLDEAGLPFNFAEQKNLMMEMDRFVITLKPGESTINRRSEDSAVTIPFENTFRSASLSRPETEKKQTLEDFDFCGCGWPQHLLIPKGNSDGFDVDLFVMISDFEIDKVDQPPPLGCRTGMVHCGLRNRKYPDSRSMGFPFDRVARPRIATLTQFLTPNMKTSKITIRFTDTVVPKLPTTVKNPIAQVAKDNKKS